MEKLPVLTWQKPGFLQGITLEHRRWIDQLIFNREKHEVDGAFCIRFVHEVRFVSLDGLLADEQSIRYFFVAVTFADELQYLRFTFSEFCHFIPRAFHNGVGNIDDDILKQLLREIGAAIDNDLNSFS